MEKAKYWYRDNSFLFEKEDDDGDTFLPNRSIDKLIEIAYLEGQISSLWKLHSDMPGPAGVYDLMRITAQDLEQRLKELLDE